MYLQLFFNLFLIEGLSLDRMGDNSTTWGCEHDYDDPQRRGVDTGRFGESLPPRYRRRDESSAEDDGNGDPAEATKLEESVDGNSTEVMRLGEAVSVVERAAQHRKTRGDVIVEAKDSPCDLNLDGVVTRGDARKIPGPSKSNNFEYLDHTADVIIRAWGRDLKSAFEYCGEGLFNYMTDIDKVDVDDCRKFEARGHDVKDLLFHFLDELLFLYGSEYFMCSVIEIITFKPEDGVLSAIGYGSIFDRNKNTQGTEVKAITMHQLKVLYNGVDVVKEGDVPQEDGAHSSDKAVTREDNVRSELYEVFVLVDI